VCVLENPLRIRFRTCRNFGKSVYISRKREIDVSSIDRPLMTMSSVWKGKQVLVIIPAHVVA
jgi:hypothetical protein